MDDESNPNDYLVEGENVTGIEIRFIQLRDSQNVVIKEPDRTGEYDLDIVCTDGSDANYHLLSSAKSITVTKVMPKARDFTITNTEFTYDGKEHFPTVTKASGKNFGAVTYSYYKDGAQVESPINPGEYTIKVTTRENDDYGKVENLEIGSFTIAKANPALEHFTVTIPTGENAVYTGEKIEAVATAQVSGMGAITVKYYTDEAMTNKVDPINAGTYYVGVITEEGDNYSAAEEPISLGSFTIAKAEINKPTFAEANETRTFGFYFNGMEKHELVTGYDSTTMALTGENLIVDGSTIYGEHAGEYNITIAPDGNHAWTDGTATALTGSYTIKKLTVEAEIPDYLEKTYDGTQDYNKLFYINLIPGKTNNNIREFTVSRGTISSANAGTHSFSPDMSTITPSGETPHGMNLTGCKLSDLDIQVRPCTATIKQRLCYYEITGSNTMEIGSQSVYTWAPTSWQISGGGLVAGDELTNVAIRFVQERDGEEVYLEEPDLAGTYQLQLCYVGEGPQNYELLNGGDLEEVTVSRRTPMAADFTVGEANFTYNRTAQTPTITIAEGKNFGTVTYAYYDAAGEAVDSPTNAGEYTIKVTTTETGWYNAVTDLEIGSFTIEKATPTAEHFTFTPPSNLEFSGSVKDASVRGPGDMGSLRLSYRLEENVPGHIDPRNPGTYHVLVQPAGDTQNYVYDSNAWVYLGEFTITPKPITVTANDKTITYGDAIPALDYDVTGLIEGYPLEGALATEATQNSDAGMYSIDQGTLSAINNQYSITFNPGTLTIHKQDGPEAPDFEVKISDDGSSHTVQAALYEQISGVEYRMDPYDAATDSYIEGTWQSGNTFTGLPPRAAFKLYARVAETTNVKASEVNGYECFLGLLTGSGSVTIEGWTYGDTPNAPVVSSSTNGTDNVEIRYMGDGYASEEVPTNAGTYTVIAVFGETDTHDTTYAQCSFTIARKSLTKPTIGGEYTYDGTEKEADITGFDDDTMTVNGVTKATNARYNSVTIELKDTANYQWADGTTEKIYGSWKIKKATPTAEHFTFTPPADLVFSGEYKNATVELKADYTGMGNINVSYVLSNGYASAPRDPATYKVGVFIMSEGNNFEEIDSWVELGEFTITPKPITVTAKNKEITYGEAIPDLDYDATGLIEGYPLEGALATEATQSSNADTYQITKGTLSARYNQYNITFTQGTLTIHKATPDYTMPEGLTATYGDQLKDVSLPDGWTWENPNESVGDVGRKTFKATYTPGDTTNYNTMDEMLEITVAKKSLTKPTVSGEYTYDGTVQTVALTGFDSSTMSIVSGNTATNAGSHTVTIALQDTANYQWAGGTTANATCTWTIAKASLTKPEISGSYTYDGAEKAAVISEAYDAATMTISGNTATVAGSHTVTISLQDKDNYQWADGTTADVTGTWTINKASLTKPTISGSYIYDTTEKEAVISEAYDESTMTVSGTTKATNVGTYTVTIKLKDSANYQWEDGTTEDVQGTWSIAKAILTKPEISGEYVYDTTEKTAVLTGFDETTMTVKGSTATNAGTHTVTIGLKDKNSYRWADDTNEDFTGTFVIRKANLVKPAISGSYIYDGTVKSVVLGESFDSSTMIVSGTEKAVMVGTHTVTIALKDAANYQWADGTVEKITGTWVIEKISLPKPEICGCFVYSGRQYRVNISKAYDSTTMALYGSTCATNAGTYWVSIALRNTATHQWEDGTTDAINGSWTICKASLNRPVISGDYSFTGKEIQPELIDFDSSLMVRGGDWKAARAGEYVMTISLRDPCNFRWKSGSTVPMLGIWHIVEESEEAVEESAATTEPERMGIVLYDAAEQMAEIEDVTSVELLYAAEALTPALYQRLKLLTPQEQLLVVLTALLDCGGETDHACQVYDIELSCRAANLVKDITAWLERMNETDRTRFEQELADWFIFQTIEEDGESYRKLTLQWLVTTTENVTMLEKYTFVEQDDLWFLSRYEQAAK